MTLEEIKEKLKDLVTISVVAKEEDYPYQREAGDDLELLATFKNMVRKYRLWGWCYVAVNVTYRDQEVVEYLGGCSYKGKKHFINTSGYYEDMVDRCLTELAGSMQHILTDFAEGEYV